jgi:hypothetical protein
MFIKLTEVCKCTISDNGSFKDLAGLEEEIKLKT